MDLKIRVGTRRRSSSLSANEALTFRKYLSPFQVEKFTYLFNALFDIERNGLIERNDIMALCEKMRSYCNLEKKDKRYENILDVQRVFYECLKDQVELEKLASIDDDIIDSWEEALKPQNVDAKSITLVQWLNMWGKLCYGSAGLDDFPIWVQLLPDIFFDIIDTTKRGVLTLEDYRRFYQHFVGLKSDELEKVAQEGYKIMTADGDYTFDLNHFKFCFANFLLGRSIYGPGQYIFGVFDNTELSKPYQVKYALEEEEEEE